MKLPDDDGLPTYDTAVSGRRRRTWTNRRRSRTLFRYVMISCILFVGYYITTIARNTHTNSTVLSISKLREQYTSCQALREVPSGPTGPRSFNKRWVNGTRSVFIRNATVWVGEPAPGTSEEDARRGVGYAWIKSDVFIDRGLIVKVASAINVKTLPTGYDVYDAKGRQLTAGIVDMHSHLGLGGFAGLGDDINELSGDITPYVRSIDGFNALAPEVQWIKSGGVTTSLLLPGSGNNMGGEAFVIKLASGKSSGREEISQEDMWADPDKTWRYMKMACGENPKSVYGKIGRGPFSRLGEAWEFRHALEQAKKHVESQDDWCRTADQFGVENMKEYLPSDLQWESLGAVLRGQVRVNTHCYTIADLESYVRHTNEFKFRVYAFHHAHQTYLVPEILKRAYGGTPAAALFADNMYYKVEAYTASEKAGKILYDQGITPTYVSDNPVSNSQHVVFEAAKAYANGLDYHVALAGVTSASAELLGLGDRIGKIKEGFDADVVVWDSDPLSIAAAPVQVWIDGAPQFEKPVELKKPETQPITPDVELQEDRSSAEMSNVIFQNLKRNLLTASEVPTSKQKSNVIVTDGSITCVGSCHSELQIATSKKYTVIDLKDGYLTSPLIAFGSSLGLLEIDAEKDTQDGGYDDESFARAVDGLSLGGKQLKTAWEHGVTRAITAPSRGSIEAKGVSVGFETDAKSLLDVGAVFNEEVAAHYPMTLRAKSPSLSAAIGELRSKLLKAAKGKKKDKDEDPDKFSEDYYLKEVVAGKLPLVISVHKADTIASLLKLKDEVEEALNKSSHLSSKPKTLRLVILGGAESYLVASDLAARNVPVVLAPLLPFAQSWDQRRSLPGAPLSNGTAIDILLDHGVEVAVGVNEEWETRGLRFMAAWAWANSQGRLNESQALDLVGKNVYDILGLDVGVEVENWLVWDGNPLDIGSRLVAVGTQGRVTAWM